MHIGGEQHRPSRDLSNSATTSPVTCAGSAATPRSGPRTTSASAAAALKTRQKISGRLTSEGTAHDRSTAAATSTPARKHGQDVLTVLKAAMTGTSQAAASPYEP